MSKNILLITCDQLSANMISCAGNSEVYTPNIDSLARDGVRFEKAYAAQPLCVPQRNTWQTGLMPHEHGITFNLPDVELRDCKMLGRIFADAGYKTGHSGKWHVNVDPEDRDRHGFYWGNRFNANGGDVHIASDFKEFLDQLEGKPFFFDASFNNPHNICEAAQESSDTLPDGPVYPPLDPSFLPKLPDNHMPPVGEPDELEVLRTNRFDYVLDWDEERWRLHHWHYCRIIEILDKRIGDMINVLQSSNKIKDTLILFTSDHGEAAGQHKLVQKQTFYEESARVPWIISKPKSEINRVDEKTLINGGIDLIPTLCGLADIQCPEGLKGIDSSQCLEKSDYTNERDYLVIETSHGMWGQPAWFSGRCICTNRYKYVVYDKGEKREFLSDLEIDPGETRDFSKDPECQEILKEHREYLKEYISDTKDPFLFKI